MEEEKFFSTRDIYLATTLITLKFSVEGIDYQVEQPVGRGNAKTVGYFKFKDTPAIRTAEKQYRQGALAVEPRTFVTNLRSLKAELTNFYKSPYNS